MKLFSQIVLGVLLVAGLSNKASCQVQYSRKYRVIAYKAGDPSVFSVSNEVEIIPAMSLYIPNTFTPNGDGLNDTFGIAGEAIKGFNIQVFNRWGELIFESGNANERWDGTFQGKKVPQGSYVYKLTAQSPTGKRVNREGQLNVIL
jgi:gliding motility-associated-like protein